MPEEMLNAKNFYVGVSNGVIINITAASSHWRPVGEIKRRRGNQSCGLDHRVEYLECSEDKGRSHEVCVLGKGSGE